MSATIAAPPVAAAARPLAIEDPSNRLLIHRLAGALLPIAVRLRLAPNAVSLAGLACGLLAAVAYWHWRTPGWALAGFAAMIAWHVLDGLDGQLARATGRSSAFGRVLDGTCDYLVFVTVEMALVFSHRDWPPLLALCLTAAAAHVFQAATYEGERAAWMRRAAGRFTGPGRPASPNWLTGGHEWIARTLGDRDRPIDAALARDPALSQRYLRATAPPLRALALLGANGRTLAIFVACLAGAPAAYWLWTLLGLSLLAFALTRRLRRAEAKLSGG